MIRWSISFTELSAGKDKDFIQAIQEQIVNYYNTNIGNNMADRSKMLKPYHSKMIRINVVKLPYKGNDHITLEFLDPCDCTTQMYFNPGTDPFGQHDFLEEIPNPTTRSRVPKLMLAINSAH